MQEYSACTEVDTVYRRSLIMIPEHKSATEPLDLARKIDDTLAGRRPSDANYPYFSPDYALPFTHIGTERQLFLDNYMLDYMDGVERILVTPEKASEPLLAWSNLPWEQAGFNPAVAGALQDPEDGLYKLWYIQTITGNIFGNGQVLCYAESTNALHWEKPLRDDAQAFGDCNRTNIVHHDVCHAGVVLNPRWREEPDHKFLLLYNPWSEAPARGQRVLSRVAASPDGVRWTVISDDVPQRHQHEIRIIWDAATQQYLGFSQYSHHWHHGPRTRQVGRQTSPDFIHWSPKAVALSVDWDPTLPPDREFHEASIRKVGGLYILIVGECHTDPLWQVGGNGANWRDQFHVTLALYVSRDGARFTRAHGPAEPWVDNGPPGSPDYGYACFTAAGALTSGGRTIIPYCANPVQQWTIERADNPVLAPAAARVIFTERYAIAKALGADPYSTNTRRTVGGLVLREDGYAALRCRHRAGRALTKQFVFEGDRLRVNADVRFGHARIEALDPHHRPYPGFSAAECDVLHGDSVWHTITWQGNSDVRALWNQPVRLAIHLDDADLYGFEFCYEGEQP
jgi:hypothetical protein